MFWNTLSSWFLGSLTGGKKQNTLQPPKPHTTPQNHSRMREKQNSVFQYCFAPICNLSCCTGTVSYCIIPFKYALTTAVI